MSYFEKVAARTPLDRHRVLSRTAGVRVSPLCLGGASLGDAWSKAGGAMGNGADEAASYALLDAYFAQGGNFIDMANNYQDGESERILGAWMRARGNRDELVITSKYTSTFKFQQGPAAGVHISANFNGNAKKSLRLSLDHTLASLGTDYVDILYVHWWDWTTSVEEMMQALNREVQAGRVLYLGASDMPAWVVSSANAYARAHALAPFSVYEGLWSILQRDMERDIVPMCRAEGMAICPWGAMGRGKLRTEAEIEERIRTRGPLRGGAPQTDLEKRVSAGLDEMVKTDFDGRISITQLALAWLLAKYPYCVPIAGVTEKRHLESNMSAVSIRLTDAQMARIEALSPFEPGFPYSYIKHDPRESAGQAQSSWLASCGELDWVHAERSINRLP